MEKYFVGTTDNCYEARCPTCGLVGGLTITAQSGDQATPGSEHKLAPICPYFCNCGQEIVVGERIELRSFPCVKGD